MLDSSLSCLELIFIFQPNIFTKSSVQPSLDGIFHYQLVFAKFELSIRHLPAYEKNQYGTTKDLIRKAIDQFDWDKGLGNNEVLLFSLTL